jgi:hypothetical protein
MTTIKDLKIGDSFRTKTGKNTCTIVDILFSKELGYKNIYLLKGGWYVSNPDKEVIRQ